jgi:hypothetical protein
MLFSDSPFGISIPTIEALGGLGDPTGRVSFVNDFPDHPPSGFTQPDALGNFLRRGYWCRDDYGARHMKEDNPKVETF